MFVANTHDTLLCFSSRGKVYWLKVYQIPQAGHGARGKPLVNLLALDEGERVTAVLPVKGFAENEFVFMVATDGTVKKTQLSEFSRPRPAGIIAVELADGARLVDAGITDGSCDILLFTDAGKVIRFAESEVRAMGRVARGVRGILLAPGQSVNALIIARRDDTSSVLTATENGYGKRSALAEYPRKGRGGQGVISIQVTARNGNVVGAELVAAGDEVMLITSGGTLIRTRAAEISEVGRNTQGVRLIEVAGDEKLASLAKVVESGEDGGDAEPQ
jgi:DNA gyrase subunit A